MSRFLIYIILLFPFVSFSQEGTNPYFIQYTIDDGLPSSEVYCSFEDSNGFMWFGTDNGVSKFDGYKFQNYGPKEGLLQNVIFNIHEDKEGKIWFGSMTGEAFYLERDTIYPYEYNDKVLQYKDLYSHSHLFHISENGDKFFNLHNYGFLHIEKNGTVNLEANQSTQIFVKDSITFLSEGGVIGIINIDTDNFDYHFISPARGDDASFYGNEFGNVANSVEMINHEILLLSNSRLFRYSKSGKLQLEKKFPFKGTNDISASANGKVLVGLSKKNGLLIYNNLKDIYQSISPKRIFKGYSINNIFISKTKDRLWITTQDNGVLLVPGFNRNPSETINTVGVSGVCPISNHEIYFGTNKGEIYLQNNQKKLIRKEPKKIHSLLYDRNRKIIWSENGYIQNGTYKRYTEVGSNRTWYCSKINSSKDMRRILGIHTKGIIAFDLIKSYNPINLALGNSGIRPRPYSIYPTLSNKILIGYSDGLFEYLDGKLNKVTHEEDLNIRIEDIDELSDSTLVLGTKGNGVILWKDTITYRFNTSHGLAADMIEDIHISDGDTIWVSTLNGLSRIVKESENPVRTFTKSNGLPTNEVFQVDTYNGTAYLATAKGLIKFSDPKLDTVSLPPTITELVYKKQKQSFEEEILLPFDDNEFEIKYVTLNFEQLGDIDYRYKILDQSDWTETKNTTAFFTNMSSGKYNFQVQSKNSDGYWSRSSEIPITIDYPWYQSWFAYGLYSLMGLSFVFFIVKGQTEQLNRKNKLMSQMLEFEKKALSAQMNPHFIFNCLNSIQNYILKDSKKNAIYYLSKFANLTRDILEISVEGQNSVKKEFDLLENYLSLEKLRFKGKFDFTIDSQIQEEAEIEIPSMLLQPFVENAVIHGMKGKESGGLISINMTRANNNIIAVIEDNGPGIGNTLENIVKLKKKEIDFSTLLDEEHLDLENVKGESEEDKKERKSYGVSLISKRLNILNPEFLDKQISIEELKDNGTVNGTRITVNLPILKKRK